MREGLCPGRAPACPRDIPQVLSQLSAVHQGCLQQGTGMSCRGLCSAPCPSRGQRAWAHLRALVTAGTPAGSLLLLEPGKTKACAARGRCISVWAAIPTRTGFFFPSSPWEVLHHLAGGSESLEDTRCLSLLGLGMLLADPGTAAPIPALLAGAGQTSGASSSTGWFPVSPFLQLAR